MNNPYRKNKLSEGILIFFAVSIGALLTLAILLFASSDGVANSTVPTPIVAPARPVVILPPQALAVPTSAPEKPQESEIPKEAEPETPKEPEKIREPEKIKEPEKPKESANQAQRKGKWILIDKSKFELTLFDGDKKIKSWGVALGRNPGHKQRKGDNRTPNGVFTVQQIQDASAWTHDFRDGNGVIKGAYGPWFIRLKTPPFTGIGIHGTHDPNSIGTLASEGCIRLNNNGIQELKKQVSLGMTVEIRE